MEDEDREVARGGEAPGPSEGEGRSILLCPKFGPGYEPRTTTTPFVCQTVLQLTLK